MLNFGGVINSITSESSSCGRFPGPFTRFQDGLGMSHGQATEDAAHNEHVQVQIWLAIFGPGKKESDLLTKIPEKHVLFFLGNL